MPIDYFDFLNQSSQQDKPAKEEPGNDGFVNLTVRADAECQVVCDGDFLFLLNANQIVKEKAPAGQHILQFISIEYPEAYVEKIVDWPEAGKNYLVIVNELKQLVYAEMEKARKRTEDETRIREEDAKKKAEEERRKKAEEDAARKMADEKARKNYLTETDYYSKCIIQNEFSFPALSDEFSDSALSSLMQNELLPAATLNNASAEYVIAQMYEKGRGVLRDEAQAVKWYRNGAAHGYVYAQLSLGCLLYWGVENGDYIKFDKTEAVQWLRRAAEQGNVLAQVTLGRLLYWSVEDGETSINRRIEAVKWFQKAAEKGSLEALRSLGECYINGEGVLKNKELGARMLEKAVECDDRQARGLLGVCYYMGWGVPKDESEGKKRILDFVSDAEESLYLAYIPISDDSAKRMIFDDSELNNQLGLLGFEISEGDGTLLFDKRPLF